MEHFYGKIPVNVTVHPEQKKEILRVFSVPKIEEPNGGQFDPSRCRDNDVVFQKPFLVNGLYKGITQSGKGRPYLDVTLLTSNGSIQGKVWDNGRGNIEECEALLVPERVVTVSGKIKEYPANSNQYTLTVSEVAPNETVNPASFMPFTEESLEELTVELISYAEELREPLRTMTLSYLKKIWEFFVIYPAAKRHHHAYGGGLLKHSVGVTRNVRHIKQSEDLILEIIHLIEFTSTQSNRDLYKNAKLEKPKPSRDLVWNGGVEHLQSVYQQMTGFQNDAIDFDAAQAAAIFHDAGKIFEYSMPGEDSEKKMRLLYPYAVYQPMKEPIGKGVGHIPLGISMLENVLREEKIEIDVETLTKVNNCVASHHGKLEWGSSAYMNSMEACILHFADFLDSRWDRVNKVQ